MSASDEISSKIKEQWVRANDPGASPLVGIAEFRGVIEVLLNREPTAEEAKQALTEIDGAKIMYSIIDENGALTDWAPSKPPFPRV